jgi:polysaccharide export outer membrane protein
MAVTALEEDKETYSFSTTINRVVGGSVESVIVSDNDPVSPGDVIRVERREQIPPPASRTSN